AVSWASTWPGIPSCSRAWRPPSSSAKRSATRTRRPTPPSSCSCSTSSGRSRATRRWSPGGPPPSWDVTARSSPRRRSSSSRTATASMSAGSRSPRATVRSTPWTWRCAPLCASGTPRWTSSSCATSRCGSWTPTTAPTPPRACSCAPQVAGSSSRPWASARMSSRRPGRRSTTPTPTACSSPASEHRRSVVAGARGGYPEAMTTHAPTSAYVLTAIGDDRPGLVAALAAAVDEHGGNWVDSQLALLGGKFAGIVQVELPDDRAQSFLTALPALADEVGLAVEATVAGGPVDATPHSALRLHLLGQDRTGMVREISSALRSQGATIDGLRSWTREAPEGGGMLFEAEAEVRLPAGADEDGVREALETIAAELMVDLELDASE